MAAIGGADAGGAGLGGKGGVAAGLGGSGGVKVEDVEEYKLEFGGAVSLRVESLLEAERDGPKSAATAAERSMDFEELSTEGPELRLTELPMTALPEAPVAMYDLYSYFAKRST